MEERFKVVIDADNKDLQAGINESEKILKRLESKLLGIKTRLETAFDAKSQDKLQAELRDTEKAITNVRGRIESLNGALQRQAQASNVASQAQQKLNRSIGNGNGVAIEFNRIIQDAPFGLIGIGNNIQQLTANFGALKSTGLTTSQALKTSFKSIFSSANLVVLGISAITAAFTAYQLGAFKSKSATKSLQDQLDEYRGSLDRLTRLSVEFNALGAKESDSFKLLKAQAENANVPLNKRIEAVNELKKQYPDYLGSLTDEQILTGQVGDAYNNLTKSLIATAKARALSEEAAKNQLDIFTLLQQEEQRANDILLARQKLASIQDQQRFATGQDLLALKNQELIQEQRIDKLIKEQLKSAGQRNDLRNEDLKLEALINGEISKGATFTKAQTSNIAEQVKEVEKLKRVYEDISKLPIAPTATPELFGQGAPKGVTKGVVDDRNKTLPEEIANYLRILEQFNNDATAILNSGIANTLGDFAFAIGEAIARGGNVLEASGAALLGGIANILNQLGQLAISAGLAIKGIKIALASLNPAIAIGAGIALVSLAGFVAGKARGLSQGIGGSAGGGSSFASSAVGNNTGASFGGGGLGFQGFGDFSLTSTIRGTDLQLILSRTANSNN